MTATSCSCNPSVKDSHCELHILTSLMCWLIVWLHVIPVKKQWGKSTSAQEAHGACFFWANRNVFAFTCASFQITFKSCRQAWKILESFTVYTANLLDRHELWFYPAGEQYAVSLQTWRAQTSSIFWYLRLLISRTRKLKHEGCLQASELPLGTVNASPWHNTVIIGKSKFQHPKIS